MNMNAIMGWVVAAIVALGAGYYIWFMPQSAQAPVMQEQTQEQSGPALQEQMAGTWRSQTDAKFTREFRADGVIYDRYEGDATPGVGGSWSVVNPAMESSLAAQTASLAGVTVIKASWEDGAEVTYFAVNKLDANSMTITDLSGRGGVTVFTKI